ncbi:hypothetical protein ACTHOQ_08025 [Solibacillus silvestris]|uniref:hypothetical protein n=1 Tax=Solibacillus silvestris TaxID=76853 RepID=UPI003F80C2AA
MENNSENLSLRKLRIEDFPIIMKWNEDARFCEANGWDLSRNQEELYKWWQRCVALNSENFIRLGIEYHDVLIGYADLADIKMVMRKSELPLANERFGVRELAARPCKSCLITPVND